MSRADELLRGAIDMHCHGYPEISFDVSNRYTDQENAELMVRAGMKGFVLKSHLWPTVGRVYYLRQAVPDLSIFSSITFNASIGGIQRHTLESAVKQGAQVVYMPTWSARGDIRRNGVIQMIRKYLPSLETFSEDDGICLIDGEERLLPEVAEILSLIKEYDIPLFTGHVSILESAVLAREAKRIGYKKLVLNHPDSRTVGATFDQIVEVASLGAYVEICALGLMPLYQRISPGELKKIIQTVGADRCVLTSDSFFDWAPSGPEMLRMLIGALLEVGVTDDQIAEMAQINPRKLLNMG